MGRRTAIAVRRAPHYALIQRKHRLQLQRWTQRDALNFIESDRLECFLATWLIPVDSGFVRRLAKNVCEHPFTCPQFMCDNLNRLFKEPALCLGFAVLIRAIFDAAWRNTARKSA